MRELLFSTLPDLWLDDAVSDGETAGTSGEQKRLEALKISLRNPSVEGGVKYRVHCQTYGWMDWKENGAEAGTSGKRSVWSSTD